jgi:hypothetical protein
VGVSLRCVAVRWWLGLGRARLAEIKLVYSGVDRVEVRVCVCAVG